MPSLVLLWLGWVMVLEPGFGMTISMEIIFLRILFQRYFSLQGIGMLRWLYYDCYIGTLILSDSCMIERWILFPLLLMFCIALGWVKEATISYVGFTWKDILLR
jgi:hypothetical protein